MDLDNFEPPETLDEVMIRTGADKASVHPVKPHSYAEHYERAFGHLRVDQIKILEIGIGSGESIRGWLDYFKNAHVYGCDIVSNTNEWNTHYKSDQLNPHPRYDFLQGDQGDKTMWACYLAYSGGDFSIVVDDGSHRAKDIQVTFDCLWPHVAPSGYYAIEDLSAGMTIGTVFLSPGYPTHSQWLSMLQEQMHLGQSDIAEMTITKELVIMRKQA